MADHAPHEDIPPNPDKRIRGPHGWLNWQGFRLGQPARDNTGAGVVVLPSWEEFSLHSDAWFTGDLKTGPLKVDLTLPFGKPTVGTVSRRIVLRIHDHLGDPEYQPISNDAADVDAYFGGDQGDEFSALIALATGRRLRSGGVTRQGFAGGDPLGRPTDAWHTAPVLHPTRLAPMLPNAVGDGQLGPAQELLERYRDLSGVDAVVVLRAASQYADALWLADTDPRVAWLKLIGALETGATQWDAARDEHPVASLRRHRRPLHRILEEGASRQVLEAVAQQLHRTFYAERKFKGFVAAFDPGPPAERPSDAQADWDALDQTLGLIYDYRSRDLHDGIPFPYPLLMPPSSDGEGPAHERFPALAMASLGGSWPADELPMHLHVFAYLTRGVLLNWMDSLAA